MLQQRQSGLDILGDIPWATHVCQFYRTKEDLVDVIVPFLSAGLQSNEFCVWVTSDIFVTEEAVGALKRMTPKVDECLRSGQLEVFPYTEWCAKGRSFDAKRVVDSWTEKLDDALARGYEGARIAGDWMWLEEKGWKDLMAYEAAVNDVIQSRRFLVLCAYFIPQCSADDILEVIESHGFALTRRGGKWEIIESLEQKRISQALRESEERYRTLFENTTDAIIVTDPRGEGKVMSANPAACRMLGYTQDECLALIRDDMLDPHNPDVRDLLLERERNGQASYTLTYRRKDGSTFEGDVSTAFFEDTKGNKRAVAIIRDITERQRAEEELRRSRDELEQRVQERTKVLQRQAGLLELAHSAILVRDTENRIIFWNTRAEEVYGWTKTEAEGNVIQTLLETRFPLSVDEYMAILLETGRWEGELGHTTKSGRRITVLSRHALQRDENGNPLAILEINLDVTEARNTEYQLRQAQKLEALGTLTGGIAHDFNNILAAIIGFSEIIRDHVPEENREHRLAQRVVDAGIRGRELVKQMLIFSRRTEEEKKPLRLSSIVKETAKLLRASIPTTISMKINIHSESGLILGEPVQIQQVLMNLATNAAHAMREKGGSLDIGLSDFSISPSAENTNGMEAGLYMKLTVRDTGVGMEPEVVEKIFDPFFTTKKVGEGTGLGLSVVLGIVKQAHGYIAVESQPDKGSIFTVYFPKIVEKPAAAGPAAGDSTIPTGRERILFVDDEEPVVEMGEELLAELGYEVICRTSSREAMALFRLDPFRFDLVITDQTMPELTGVELARELLAIRRGLPVILCTGFSHIATEESAKAAGIQGFAMKPLAKREIAKIVRKVLDGRKQA